jgi:hypothetical protein
MRFKVFTNFSKISDEELPIFWEVIKNSLDENYHFPNPNPSLASIDEYCQRYKAALQEFKLGKGDVDKEKAKEAIRIVFQEQLELLEYFVRRISNGDVEKIKSSGFEGPSSTIWSGAKNELFKKVVAGIIATLVLVGGIVSKDLIAPLISQAIASVKLRLSEPLKFEAEIVRQDIGKDNIPVDLKGELASVAEELKFEMTKTPEGKVYLRKDFAIEYYKQRNEIVYRIDGEIEHLGSQSLTKDNYIEFLLKLKGSPYKDFGIQANVIKQMSKSDLKSKFEKIKKFNGLEVKLFAIIKQHLSPDCCAQVVSLRIKKIGGNETETLYDPVLLFPSGNSNDSLYLNLSNESPGIVIESDIATLITLWPSYKVSQPKKEQFWDSELKTIKREFRVKFKSKNSVMTCTAKVI